MTKLLLVSILLSSMLIQSQTLEEFSYSKLGYSESVGFSGLNRKVAQTSSGTINMKLKVQGRLVTQITFTFENTHRNYTKLVSERGYGKVRLGSRWTDITYSYKPIKMQTFNSVEDARIYYNKMVNSKFKAHSETKIYKKPDKDKYIVGKFVITPDGLYIDDYTKRSARLSNKWEVIK